ncbi:MAG: DUF4365 domain-containing protein [Leptospirales bacterium]|nr:DUF4365 domain-containing protein [Leptospirales bacterium]
MSKLPKTHQQDYFACGYLEILLSKADLKGLRDDKDYGVDYHVNAMIHRKNAKGKREYRDDDTRRFKIQLKSTTERSIKRKANNVCYSLRTKNYNDLIDAKIGLTKMYLFLLVLPRDRSKWLSILDKETEIYQRCYYFRPSVKKRRKSSAPITIKIPEKNRVDIPFLKTIV